jgi:DNA-binding IclR family transcriptional regulator
MVEEDIDDASEGASSELEGKKTYRAPALEKGFDILELLASEGVPLAFPVIAQRLGRSTGELFRMAQVLEARGYVEQVPAGLMLTSRMFEVGLSRPPIRNLVEIALPIMRRLADATQQSCHLVLPSRGDMVVVARMESPEQIGFSVRVGYRQPLYLTGSGTVLYAYQPDDVRTKWEAMFHPKPAGRELAQLRTRAEALIANGHARQPSTVAEGITDLSVPVMRGERAAAALAIPFLQPTDHRLSIDEIVTLLLAAAADISREIVIGDSRA